jgi:putative RecB family exonuclease
VEAEYEFDVDRPDLQQKFKGKLDVATTNEIWDWKTGSIRDDTAEKEKIQGAVYMAAYRVAYGHSPEAIRFVYLKEGQVRTIEPSTDTWQFMLSHARNLAKSIRTENFEAKPGDQCYWCDFEQFCPAAGGIGADFSWEAWMA